MKELEDYNWFPHILRNFQTDFIGFVASKFNLYDAYIDYLKEVKPTKNTMIDLCSGSGEPAISIFNKSNCFTHLTLSDKYPQNLKLNDSKIPNKIEQLDVLDMHFLSNKSYTMFNAFHHFSENEKGLIVEKIEQSNSNAFIVEVLQPSFICFLKVFFTTTVGMFFLSPFLRPFSFWRLFFTYILPINLFTICYDGLVSVIKSGSLEQYQKMFSNKEFIKVLKVKKGLSTLIIIHIQAR